MNTVIFLDIDGVLVTSRSHAAFGLVEQRLPFMNAFDPVAVNLIQALCVQANAKIVISSTWRFSVSKTMLLEHFHNQHFDLSRFLVNGPHWETPRLFSEGRTAEITLWLEDNDPDGELDFLIVDDATIHGALAENAVKCEFDDGFSFKNFQDSKRILGVEK